MRPISSEQKSLVPLADNLPYLLYIFSSQAVLVILMSLFSSRLLAQQSNSGSFADSNNPLGPGDLSKPGDIWSLDPTSGAVHIQIPIGTVPTGGRGPKVRPILQYNSSSTVTLSAPMPSQILNNICIVDGTVTPCSSGPVMYSFSWLPPDYNWSESDVSHSPVGNGPVGPWTTTYGPSIFYGNSSTNINGYLCTSIEPMFADAEGQIHDLNISDDFGSYGPFGVVCPQVPVAYVGTSLDGSNIIASTDNQTWVQSNPGYVPPWGGNLNPLLLPDGSQIIPSAASVNVGSVYSNAAWEDSNGNIFTDTGIDSEGRNAAVSRLGTQDVQPGSYSIVTKDQSGNSESYTISVSKNSFSGCFTMPHPTATTADIGIYNGENSGQFSVYQPSCNSGQMFAYQVLSLGLPDATSYQFSYDPTYGTISKITFPTGGYVKFVWSVRGVGTLNTQSTLAIREESTLVATDVYLSASSSSEDEKHWHYVYQDMSSVTGALVTTETDPDGTQTIYTASPFGYGIINSYFTPRETYRQVSDASGQTIFTVATIYDPQNGRDLKPAQVATSYKQSSGWIQKQVAYSYDQYLNETERNESGFYPCQSPCTPPTALPTGYGWLRKTQTNYLWSSPNVNQPTYSNGYLAANIVNKPSQVTIADGAGSILAQTQYYYDETALSGSVGILNHDDINYPASKVGPRGNLTTEKHCVSIVSNSCTSWISKSTTYDLTGMPVSMTDFNGNPTTYSYADAYVSGGPSSPTNAYPTAIQTGSSTYTRNLTYNYYTGSVATDEDWNSNTTTYSYADPLNRLTGITLPVTSDGTNGATGSGGTSYSYTDSAGAWKVEKDVVQNHSQNISNISILDGLGRVTQTQQLSGSTIIAKQDTTYDAMGRVYTTTNPYLSTTDASYGIRTNFYDALGRISQVQNPDGSSKLWYYDGLNCPSTSPCTTQLGSKTGAWVDSFDELGNHTQRTSDAAGSLISVIEPRPNSGGSALETNYSYDALSNLQAVNQIGGTGDTARKRSFTYDGLSRLLCASNPENSANQCPASAASTMPSSGVTLYSYDANGNLLTKISPLVNARSGTQTITYNYDTLNRLLSKTYSAGAPSSCYQYDVSTFGLTGGNFIGRLTNSWTQTSGTCLAAPPATGVLSRHSILAYDAMGRLTSEQQCTRASCGATVYSPSYTYDLAGEVINHSSGIPSGAGSFVFKNTYDAGGHLASVSSNNTLFPTGLFSAIQSSSGSAGCNSSSSTPAYSPSGGLQNAIFGVGLQLTRSYDTQLRVNCETDFGNSTLNPTSGTAKIVINGTDQIH